MIQHFLEERGQLLRGLAHPMALGMGPVRRGGGRGACVYCVCVCVGGGWQGGSVGS